MKVLILRFLEKYLSKESSGAGGRRPYDYVLMFKIPILQSYYSQSDEQAEFKINDRLSVMRFPDLSIADDIPDSRTVWHFRKQLTEPGLVKELFALFLNELQKFHLILI
ncbi:MAG: transposase [Prevotellaceae bacterium]|jgi:transposase|nr:transposase [Prevotellaceae bacterium]